MAKNRQRKQKPVLEGVVRTTGSGVGFVEHPDFEEDILIQQGDLATALDNDRVKIVLHPKIKGERQSGEVTQILERSTKRFVGTLEKVKDAFFLLPDNNKMYVDIYVPSKLAQGAKDGEKVVVEILEWNDVKKNPLGKVVEKIGMKGEHEVEMKAILLSKGIEYSFPRVVEEEAQAIKDRAEEIFQKEASSPARVDIRDRLTLTIDPVDAKDFDDALSFRELENGDVEIGVHIADVAFYVEEDSAIDREARSRAFTTYLVDRTIPMLPEVLSNDLCSLNPNEDKLAFSGFFVFSPEDLSLKSHSFARTLIHSDTRFTYEEAQQSIENEGVKHHEELTFINTVAKQLRQKRFDNGAIDFAEEEVRFELDENGKPVRVYEKKRLDAHKLIEEFMLLCNKYVARYVHEYEKKQNTSLPFMYRTHDKPDQDKLQELSIFLEAMGYSIPMKKTDFDHHALNQLLLSVKDTPLQDLVSNQVLRAMAKAKYSVQDTGHFGLAFKHYSHFTSPIRRYPDLAAHRALWTYLQNETISRKVMGTYKAIADHSSNRELSVLEAERESVKYKQVEYLSSKVGEIFDGVISGVSEYGIYVEELQTKAQGMIRVRSMTDDYYELRPKQYALVGQESKKTYRVGETVKVRLTNADLDKKQIDFEFVE